MLMDLIQECCCIWYQEIGCRIYFYLLNFVIEYEWLKVWLVEECFDVVIYFVEQCVVFYLMKIDRYKVYIVNNNINVMYNLLVVLVEIGIDVYLVYLGMMGVYGYFSVGVLILEGYLDVDIDMFIGKKFQQILYLMCFGLVYYMIKLLDQILFQFYVQNDGLCIIDLYQGIVWGMYIDQICCYEQLINCFDYDGDYGMVLNCFLIQVVIGYLLIVYGIGGQMWVFIYIQDLVCCIELVLKDVL